MNYVCRLYVQNQFACNTNELMSGTNHIVGSMDEVSRLSSELAENSEDLKSEVDRFKT